jgi:P27 family predicted phage terminase small subunit
LLTPADRQVLAVACAAWSRWVDATTLVGQFGIMSRGDRGLVKASYVQIARDAEATLARCWAALGLSPADRSRMELPERERQEDIAKRYFQ